MPSRRVKRLLINPMVLAYVLGMGSDELAPRFRASGFPQDGRIVGGYFDWSIDRMTLMIESKEFEVVPDGGEVPFFQVTFEMVNE